MLVKIALYLLFSLSISQCSPSVEDYINKAKKSLEKEDAAKAEVYFNLAYERSIATDFFPMGRDKKFSKISRSLDGKKVYLTPRSQSKLAFKTLYIFDVLESDYKKVQLPKVATHFSSSPTAKFLLFTTIINYKKNECTLLSYNVIDQEFINFPLESTINCKSTAGIDDEGNFLYEKNGVLFYYTKKTNSISEKYKGKKLDKLLKKIPEKSNILCITMDQFVMTYGNVGIYKAYLIKQNQLTLLSKKITASKIITSILEKKPGFFLGGAGSKKLTFFANRNNKKTFTVTHYLDLDYQDEENYYFVADKILYKVEDLKEKELPFVAIVLVTTIEKSVFFLSRIGTLIKYQNSIPLKATLPLFKKVHDLLD